MPDINTLLIDKTIADALDRDGFALIRGAYSPIVRNISECYQRTLFSGEESISGYASTTVANRAYRKQVDTEIRQVVGDILKTYVKNFQIIYSNFLVKRPARDTSYHLHQDLTFVDENKYSAINIWSPITPSTVENGCLEFIKGSHKIVNSVRGRDIRPLIDDIESDFTDDYFTAVTAQPGDIVIFNTKTLHRSKDNLSKQTRIAVSTVIADQDAELIHCLAEREIKDNLKILKVDPGFFTDFGIFEPIDREYPSTDLKYTPQYFKNIAEFDEKKFALFND